MTADGPRTVVDPTTGRPILMAPQRQSRPMHTGRNKIAARCPFCAGHEQETPPAIDAVPCPDGEGAPWLARAFANKYPAAPLHEVIAEGPAHTEHPVDLDRATLRAAAELWLRRMRALEQTGGAACTYLFKNVGARAGASIAHNHSQILGLDELPPRIELERAQQRAAGRCLVCDAVAAAEREQRVVCGNGRYVVLTPEPSKLPFESWLAPRACSTDVFSADLDALAEALHDWFAALGAALSRPAFNLWLHRVPAALQRDDAPFHWHFELQPRTGQLAGLELGGDMYINSVPATEAARRLRDGLAVARPAR